MSVIRSQYRLERCRHDASDQPPGIPCVYNCCDTKIRSCTRSGLNSIEIYSFGTSEQILDQCSKPRECRTLFGLPEPTRFVRRDAQNGTSDSRLGRASLSRSSPIRDSVRRSRSSNLQLKFAWLRQTSLPQLLPGCFALELFSERSRDPPSFYATGRSLSLIRWTQALQPKTQIISGL